MESSVFCNRCGGQNLATAQLCAHCGATSSAGVSTSPPAATSSIQSIPSTGYARAIPNSGSWTNSRQYGGFWLRVVAAIIDAIIVQAVVWPVSLFIGFVVGLAGASVQMPHAGIRLVAIIVGATLGMAGHWLYEATMESSSRQATLGKMALGLKVTDLEGKRISFGRATGRCFAKYLSSMILCIGYIMAGLTERKQALHDILAGTLVWRS